MTRRIGSLQILLAAVALVLVAAALSTGCAPKGGPGGFGGMPPTNVETAAVAQGTVADRFEAIGTVEAADAITVVSEVDATVVALPFTEGGAVEKGGLIAQMDDDQAQAEVARTEALSAQAKSSYDRVKSVVDLGAAAPQDLDDAEAALKVAEANVALAKARLKKTRIVAPFAGVLGARRVSPGAFVRSGDAITNLAQLGELRVNFSVPERYLSRLHRGAEVTVSTTAYPGYELTGRIDVVDPVLDPATRTAQVVARVRNPGGKFRPGMSANVAAILSERANALTVPNEAVFAEGDQSLVYVIKADSTVARTAITLGSRYADVVEVVSGLEAGQSVVRAGHQKLFPGAKVNPVASQPGGTPGGTPGAVAPGGAP